MRKQPIILLFNLGAAFLAALIISSYLLNFSASSWRDELILLTLLVLIILYFLGRKYIIKPILQIQHDLSDTDDDSFSKVIEIGEVAEFRKISQAINAIKQNVKNASRFIGSIGEGQLDIRYSEDDQSDHQIHDPLKEALISMSAKMKEIAENEKERRWIAEGLTKFIDLLRANNEELESLSSKIISTLVKYTEVNQGGLFIVNRQGDGYSEDETWLELVGCYAYNKKKFLNKRVNVGEGILGQAFLEKATVHLTSVPDDYIEITSGLGEAPPKNILIVPLKTNEEVYGLIELASFKEFPSYKIDLIERLGENIASTISGIQVNKKTRVLLRESQQQTEELRAQEEEMRQNQEEMQATQEAIERKQKELEVSEKRSTAIFENSSDAILVSDRNGQINALNHSAKVLLKVDEPSINSDGRKIFVQQFIKKFDPEKADFFLEKRRRTKAVDANQNSINVEVYMATEELAGMPNYFMYVRDITKQIEKEHQIAQNLMNMDEMKTELLKMKTS